MRLSLTAPRNPRPPARRRHYAKHNALRETELALWVRTAGVPDVKLSLDACARHYHLRGAATIVVTAQPRGADKRRSRLVPRRLSSSISGSDDDDAGPPPFDD